MEELRNKIRNNILYRATENDAGESFAEEGLGELLVLFSQEIHTAQIEILEKIAEFPRIKIPILDGRHDGKHYVAIDENFFANLKQELEKI